MRCNSYRPETAREQIQSGAHSPPKFRWVHAHTYPSLRGLKPWVQNIWPQITSHTRGEWEKQTSAFIPSPPVWPLTTFITPQSHRSDEQLRGVPESLQLPRVISHEPRCSIVPGVVTRELWQTRMHFVYMMEISPNMSQWSQSWGFFYTKFTKPVI